MENILTVAVEQRNNFNIPLYLKISQISQKELFINNFSPLTGLKHWKFFFKK